MTVILAGADTSASSSASVAAVDIETLFAEHSRYVAGIGLRLLGQDTEIDDLVQDVFLDALRGIASLRDPAAIRGWLATLTVRAARRRIRRRRLRRLFSASNSIDYSELVDPQATPEERLLLIRCYQELDGLPANQRLAWILRYVEGEALRDVAERCECSLATAKRQILRAQAHLQKVLGDA